MAPGADYATRDELDDLRRDLVNTERLLRDRDDQKQAELRAEFIKAIQASDERHDQRFDKIDDTLEHQNEMMAQKAEDAEKDEEAKKQVWPTWWRTVALYVIATVMAALLLAGLHHYHVG